MITIYDSEAIIKIYKLLNKRCDVIDKFIKNHAYYFGPYTEEYGSNDVFNNIIDLMQRKNQLINLKVIVDKAISSLPDNDKKVLLLKMNYNVSVNEICGVLELKERTAFRRIERAFEKLTEALNQSKYYNSLISILNTEEWIIGVREEVKDRRMSFKTEVASI